jgi:hypothetical protein
MADFGPEADCPVLAKILQKLPVRARPNCGRSQQSPFRDRFAPNVRHSRPFPNPLKAEAKHFLGLLDFV